MLFEALQKLVRVYFVIFSQCFQLKANTSNLWRKKLKKNRKHTHNTDGEQQEREKEM